MKKKIAYLSLISICCLMFRVSAQDDSSADADSISLGVLLEEGIYLQETKSDYEEAIEIYSELLEAGKPFEAEALYRIGVCYQALGRDHEAEAAFQKLVDNYPAETKWLEAAKEQLPSVLKPLPAPWQDGERLHLRVELPGGRVVLDQMITAQKKDLEGKPVWRFDNRSYGLANSHSSVEVDPETFRPIQSRWFHSSLGDANAWYSDKDVRIEYKDKAEPLVIESQEVLYDNEQALYLFRQIPFEVGKSWNLKILPILTGQVIELKVEVVDREKVSVPAGEFDCYKVFLHLLKQTFWYSVDSPHYPVKFQAGATGDLVEIGQTNPGESKKYVDEQYGVSFRIPDEWFIFENPMKKGHLQLVDSDATGNNWILIKPVDSFSDHVVTSLESLAEHTINKLKSQHGSFEVRSDSTEEFEHAGSPAISFVANFVDIASQGTKTRREVIVIGDTYVVRFITHTYEEDYESYQAGFDAVINSFEWL